MADRAGFEHERGSNVQPSPDQARALSIVRLLLEAQAATSRELAFDTDRNGADVILSLEHAQSTLYVRVDLAGSTSWVLTPLPRDRVLRGVSWTPLPSNGLAVFIGEKVDALLRRAEDIAPDD